MSKYLIIVEGKADIIFIKDYLMFIYKHFKIIKELNKKNKKEIVIQSTNIEIKILIAGGYTVIKENKFIKSMEEHKDSEYKILIIQDADNPKKDDGGVENRMKYLNDTSIEFKTFLFPNNKDDGDLETLLLQIKNNNKYNSFFECYSEYVKCIKTNTKLDYIDELLEDKNKVFSYFTSYYGMDKAKEENREYTLEYWNFNSDSLKPLKIFIEKNIV
ncbi:MAG: DUF3226 domain-containing protein [Campylobacterota bacterium]|nr:DUF3226 domain-containing protein [Campylobacterota bacterium]